MVYRIATLKTAKLWPMALAISALLWPLSWAAEVDGKRWLRYRFPQGIGVEVTSLRDVDYVREVMGNVIPTQTQDSILYVFHTLAVGDQGMDLELEYRQRSRKNDDPMIQAETDFSPLLEKRARFFMDPQGSMSKFTGFDLLPVIEFPGQQQQLTEIHYRNELIDLLPRLPDRAVAIGDSWSYDVDVWEPIEGGRVDVLMSHRYTVAGTELRDGMESFKLEGVVALKIVGQGSSGGIDFVVRMAGKGSNTAFFAFERSTVFETKGELEVEGGAFNDELDFSIKTRHTIKTQTKLKWP